MPNQPSSEFKSFSFHQNSHAYVNFERQLEVHINLPDKIIVREPEEKLNIRRKPGAEIMLMRLTISLLDF